MTTSGEPRRTLLYLLPVLVFAGLAAFLYQGLYLRPSEIPSPLIGKPAPAFDLPALEGLPGGLSRADLAGKVSLVSVFASWCGPCRREIPAIAAFAKSHPEIQVLGVDYLDDVADAATFAKANGATWPSVVDDGPIGSGYKVPGLPTTFLINSQGQIVERILGEVTEPMLAARIKAMNEQ